MKNKLYILLFLAFFFFGHNSLGTAEGNPKAGEGISSFLLRHNRSPKKYYDDFIELNKQKLGKNNVLKVGVTYVIPPIKKSPSGNTGTKQQSPKAKSTKIGTTLNQPLFGKQLADVKVTSTVLPVLASMWSAGMEVLIQVLSGKLVNTNCTKMNTLMILPFVWHVT